MTTEELIKKGTVERYALRGVSSSKEDVHKAIKHLDPGLFPGAFCKILPDIFTWDPNYCLSSHVDSAGTKVALAYLAWKQHLITTEEWIGIVIDSMVMNIDDLGCVGAVSDFLVVLDINRNKMIIPGDIVEALINGCQQYCDHLTKWGSTCHFASGETADVGDLTRTATVSNTVTIRMPRSKVIDASRIKVGDFIVGFSSYGDVPWEDQPNSGIGANGLTSARHDSLCKTYQICYPETFAPETDLEVVYSGKHLLKDPLPGDDRFTVGSALLSPTRTYMPLIRRLTKEISPNELHALIHCTGGGQAKIAKFGGTGKIYRKDNFLPVPPVFLMLQKETGMSLADMAHVFNMGHRLEAVVPGKIADRCEEIAMEMGIEARTIGRVLAADSPDSPNKVLFDFKEKTEDSGDAFYVGHA